MALPDIDTEIQSILDASDAAFLHDPDSIFGDPGHFDALRALPSVTDDPRVEVTNQTTPHGLRLRIYDPRGTSDRPLILFFHSGGFVFGSPEAEEAHAQHLAAEIGAVVVSVDYRLAPEHPHPAAIDDAYQALLWSAAHAVELDVDPSRIAVAGASAGGTLAALTALRSRDEGGPTIRFQLLVYPGVDDRLTTPSARTYVDTPILTRGALINIWRYLGSPEDSTIDRAPGSRAYLTGLPAALVMVAEIDPLRDEGIDFAQQLSAAGVSTELIQLRGTVHGFDLIFPHTKVARRALGMQVEALAEALRADAS